ncbi:hypothetical protein U6T54_12855, partial [Cutibacterium acnes]
MESSPSSVNFTEYPRSPALTPTLVAPQAAIISADAVPIPHHRIGTTCPTRGDCQDSQPVSLASTGN